MDNPTIPVQPSNSPDSPIITPGPIATPPPLPQQTPTPIGQPPVNQPPQPPITNVPPPKSKGFPVFIVLSILVLLAIWGVVGYLYYQNNILEKDTEKTENQTPEATPTPQFSADEIQISNGNVARITSFGETNILIKKEDYPGTGITGFVRVKVAPDNSKFCFESIAPALQPALYISNVDGSNPTEVEKDRNTCTWSPDSKSLFYVNARLTDPKVNIYQYNLDTQTETNVTLSTQTENSIRQYSITSQNGNILDCKYDVVNASGTKLSESTCTIDMTTGEVTESS